MPYSIIPVNGETNANMIEQNANSFLLVSGNEALLIDAGYAETAPIIEQTIAQSAVIVKGIYLTHYHPDHSLGALPLARKLRIPIHCHPLEAAALQNLYEKHFSQNAADILIPDLVHGAVITFAGEHLEVLHTPGHSHGHIAIFDKLTGSLFAGDTVLPGGTVWIGPPDGHLQDYLNTLNDLQLLPIQTLYPGHGPALSSPQKLIRLMADRRLEREQDILCILQVEEASVEALTTLLYAHKLPSYALWTARKTITAHLQKLLLEHRVALRYESSEKTFYYRLR